MFAITDICLFNNLTAKRQKRKHNTKQKINKNKEKRGLARASCDCLNAAKKEHAFKLVN